MLSPKDVMNATDQRIAAELDTFNFNITGPGTSELRTQLLVGELARRAQDRQARQMVNCTKWITAMTVAITLMTAANLLLAFLILRHATN
jgi:hypothetical protein